MSMIRKIFGMSGKKIDQSKECGAENSFNMLCELLDEEFGVFDIQDYKSVKFQFLIGSVIIRDYSKVKESKMMKKLKKHLLSLKLADEYPNTDVAIFDFDQREYNLKRSFNMDLLYSTVSTMLGIEKVITKDIQPRYEHILEKYDTTFYSLYYTILEMKESTGISKEDKELIIEILSTFIEEFKSLEAAYARYEQLDKQAISNSLQQRLKDELELVNRIKSDWSDTLAIKEIKIDDELI